MTTSSASGSDAVQQPVLDTTNPFAAPSPLPYELPLLDLVKLEHFLPAIDAGFLAQRAEWEAVASNPEPATFANTV